MLSLDTKYRKLQIVLAGAVSATQAAVVTTYEDRANRQRGDGLTKTTATASNDTTDVDIVPVPATGYTRRLKHLSIYNRDSATITVTIKIDDTETGTAVETIVCKFALATLETLLYSETRGFYILDANGSQKSTAGTDVSTAMSTSVSAGLGVSVAKSFATSAGLATSLALSAATSAGLRASVLQSEITSGTI